MDVALAAGVAIALAFAFANGLNDAANAYADFNAKQDGCIKVVMTP